METIARIPSRAVCVGLAFCMLLIIGCGRPPQIGTDETVYGEVDALYTAVTAKRPDLLDQSRSRLAELNRTGKLPPAAFQRLNRICEQAQRQEWQPAAEQLWTFMRGQRKS